MEKQSEKQTQRSCIIAHAREKNADKIKGKRTEHFKQLVRIGHCSCVKTPLLVCGVKQGLSLKAKGHWNREEAIEGVQY
jgi:hypothetical protein